MSNSCLSLFLTAKEALKSSPYVPDSLLEGAKFVLLPEQDPLTAAVLAGRCVAVCFHFICLYFFKLSTIHSR